MNEVNGPQLKSLIERIERLEKEKSLTSDDIKEVYSEAKSHGFDTSIMKECVKQRKLDAAEREERQMLMKIYGEQLDLF